VLAASLVGPEPVVEWGPQGWVATVSKSAVLLCGSVLQLSTVLSAFWDNICVVSGSVASLLIQVRREILVCWEASEAPQVRAAGRVQHGLAFLLDGGRGADMHRARGMQHYPGMP
jgi:hypothetical protein